MENIVTNIEILYESAKNYADTKVELLKLNAVDKSADIVSSLTSRLIFIMIVAMFFLILSFGVSLLIGKSMGEYYLGFLIVSGFYFILAIVVLIYSDKIIKAPIANLVIAKLLKTKSYDNTSQNN